MRTLKHRLARLEKADVTRSRTTRCATCRSWPAARIVEIDTDGNETWKDPDAPAVCPECGWTPVVVEIAEVADWGSVGRPG